MPDSSGGHWRLAAPVRAWRMVGRRVRVEGVRDGYDLLAVERIGPTGEPRPRREPVVGRRAMVGAMIALGLLAVVIVLSSRT